MMIFRKTIASRYCLVFGLVPTLILFYSVLSANEVVVIKVKYRKAAELVSVVQTMLSTGGIADLQNENFREALSQNLGGRDSVNTFSTGSIDSTNTFSIMVERP